MDNKQAFQKHQKKVKFQVDSKYSILEIIGEGAYGVVCSAVDNTNGQRVAIKKICGVFDVPSITKRTLRELKILKHFKHDNVISIKEILRPPSNMNEFRDVYVVMDLMGSDLHHIIHSKQDLSQEHIRYFLYQLLRGLKYIHSANIIHRDLKPSNLLINTDCELKIGDFGMARSLSTSVSEKKRVMTEYVATRWYRAPELMLSVHQFTKAIDVWSVGCIFAEMLGREALFPGSNYLNQLQLILSVVGVPSVDFMATITSERVRSYIGRLPHKSPVSFATLYPNASRESIELLGELLILDPRKRVSVEEALQKPFVEKYHDLDDEPTCRKFDHNIEAIPIERDILKEHILQEIQHYHSKRAKPNLAPIQTDLLKSYKSPMVTSAATAVVRFNDTPQHITAGSGNSEQKTESRKRKQKGQSSNHTNKKKIQVEPAKSVSNELSMQDKELLQRWSKMQTETKPFIHPIRKHMDELLQLKAEATVKVVPQSETVKGQAIVDRVSTTNKMAAPLQFTNFVPQQKNGGVTLVAEQTIRMPVISSSGTSVKTLNVATAKPSLKTRNAPVLPANKAPQTILVPVGNMPMFQLPYGAFSANAPIVIFPNLNAPKVSAPRHIAPKPVQLTNVNIPCKIRASSSTIIAPSTLPSTCVSTCTKIIGVTNCIIDKSKLLATTCTAGSTSLIKVRRSPEVAIITTSSDKKQLVEQTAEITVSNLVSTASSAIPSSSIHFNVISTKEENEGMLNMTSDDKSKCEVLSADLLSARGLCSSAGSFLSELNISSAELNSTPPSPQIIPLPQVSPEESAQVIAQVKKLDEEDKKIVSMIEELEETNEHSGNTQESETSHDINVITKNVASSSTDIQPCTTLPSSHTDNWSIVKNMLVNSIRAKQLKKVQSEVPGVANTVMSFSSSLSTSITTSSLPMQTSVHYVSHGSVTAAEQCSTNVITKNLSQQVNQEPCTVEVSSSNSLCTSQQYSTQVFPNNLSQEYNECYASEDILSNPLETFKENSKNMFKNLPQTSEECKTTLSDIPVQISQPQSINMISKSQPQMYQEHYSTQVSSNIPVQISQQQSINMIEGLPNKPSLTEQGVYSQDIPTNPLQTNGDYYLPVITKCPNSEDTANTVPGISSVPLNSNSSSSTFISVIQQSPIQTCSTDINQQQPYDNIVRSINSSDIVSEYHITSSNNFMYNTSQYNLSTSLTDFPNYISTASSVKHIPNFNIPNSSSIQHDQYQENITSNNSLSTSINGSCISTSVEVTQMDGGEYHPIHAHQNPSINIISENICSLLNATSNDSSHIISNYNISTNFTQPLDSSNFSILNMQYPSVISSNKNTIIPSQSPFIMETTKISPLKMDNVMCKGIPEIKVEGVLNEMSCSVKREGTSDISCVKVEGKVCKMLKPLLLPNRGIDIQMKELKEEEENNETLLSQLTGNLTPLLRCSISDVDDAFLTTFVNTPKTPKSGAGGYGLGMGFEDLFAGTSIDLLNPLRQSASQSELAPPLSASLLNDWLGINDIDPADFEDLQRELESTSYSLLDTA